MNLCEFIEDYNFSPITIDEFAAAASMVEDCDEIRDVASAFLDAQQMFLNKLKQFEIEIG